MTTLQQNDLLNNLLNLCGQAGSISDYPPDIQQNWLQALGQLLMNWEDLIDVTLMMRNKVLYEVALVWDNLAKDATYKWEWDYYKWARAFIKSRGRSPAKETIDNRITVYRDWVASELIEYPSEVEIPERDEAGRTTGQIIKVSFDPTLCDYSKLLISRGTARKGGMTPQAWSLLRDPYATVYQLEEAIGLGKSNSNEEENGQEDKGEEGLKFIEEGGIIYAKKYGHEVAVLETLFENTTDPLFKEAVQAVYARFGLEVPFELRL